jgi:bifunctional non-homologous end joining protein LigD
LQVSASPICRLIALRVCWPWLKSQRWSFIPGTVSPASLKSRGGSYSTSILFDLDPASDVEFTAVIEAAREIRDRLNELGLLSFCKTTGGKGLHVVAPLALEKDGKTTWPQAKAFARKLCAQVAADNPGRYVIKMAKKERSGRIYLDYLRNDMFASAVAPLSPRMHMGAPVSMPLSWQEVGTGLDPQRFTLRTAPGLISDSTAWQEYCASERPLTTAMQQLGGLDEA